MRTELNITRLTIDLPSDMHRLIKAKASLQNITIKEFVMRAIENDVSDKPSKNKPNKKTKEVLERSIKNSGKLKSFKNSKDAMKWLLS